VAQGSYAALDEHKEIYQKKNKKFYDINKKKICEAQRNSVK
jgi:hypothetical protein